MWFSGLEFEPNSVVSVMTKPLSLTDAYIAFEASAGFIIVGAEQESMGIPRFWSGAHIHCMGSCL